MAEVIRMPRLSDTMEEGNIIGWQKKVGDKIEPGDILAEVETDKATMELESFSEGILLHIGVQEGPVPVEGVIAIIGEKGENIEDLLKEIAASEGSNGKPEEAPREPEKAVAPVTSTESAQNIPSPAPTPLDSSADDGRTKASPLARKMAVEAGLDINRIQGSGEGGRIIKRDIEEAKAQCVPSHVTAPTQPLMLDPTVEYGDKPLSQMRKVIAKRLGQSKFTSPHFYLTMEINMDNAVQSRKEINEDESLRISFNDIIVKASAMALRKHPNINASWYDDKITVHREINIGVAVAVDEGLIVPVIRNADMKSMSMINREVRELAGKARERKIQPEEMTGNTFTISNLGMFDIDEFTAIINPPDACILAVGSIVKKPVVVEDKIDIAHIMKVTLSCDHRIVDGATGARFLQTLKAFLESPVRMLA